MSALPKQWKHWCSSAKLKPHARGCSARLHGGLGWLYLRGRGYYWRVNDKGMLQRGDCYAEFDRWALCEINERPLPKTRAEFIAAVSALTVTGGAAPTNEVSNSGNEEKK